MEKNIINENIEILEDKYEEYIIKTINNINEDKLIQLKGKILYYLKKPVFFYYCKAFSNTKYNPFDVDIIFGFEFIEGEAPYVTILTDFIDPTLKDNRNYYLCLAKDYKYKFSLKDLPKHEIILKSMIGGISNFLTYVNEMLAVNAFIFFGEYDCNHIYQINDFLKYRNYLGFYRINEIINNKQEERYIIITKLYFLFFAPTSEDKALVKILFYQKLKDMNFIFDRNEERKSLILKLNKTKYKNDIEFIILNRNLNIVRKDSNSIDEEEDKIKDIDEILGNDDKSDYSVLKKDWSNFQDIVKFSYYDIVLNEYKILFIDSKINIKFNDKKIDKLDEYNKNIEFNEKLISLYEKLGLNNYAERVNKLKSNIIYMCSELVDYAENQNGEDNEYLKKIRKYIPLKK